MASKLRVNSSLELYATLMGEVKVRAWAIGHTVAGKTGLDDVRAREFGFLQLRMMCELTALACLLAHDDFEAASAERFVHEAGADRILKGLERLNPSFFPSALAPPVTQPNGVKHFALSNADCMTKEELLTLYSRTCGTALHIGNLRNLRKATPAGEGMPEVQRHAMRLMNLLSIHRIYLEAPKASVLCFLRGPLEAVEMILGEASPRND